MKTTLRLTVANFVLATPLMFMTAPSLLAQTERVQLTLLGTCALEPDTRELQNLRTDGSLLFNLGQNFLTVTDFADPSGPTMRSQFAVNGGVALEVGDALAFVATTSQVQIIDFRNASVPVLRAIYGDGVASNGDATALRLMGSTLFLGSASFIDSIDVSDPAHPVKMGTYTNSPLPGGWGMLPLEASGSRLYYGYWNTAGTLYSGICILDASNPAQLTELHSRA